ncbi:MAG: ATP-dependent Clp protease ATP-binding subunit [Acidobacteria bacterium]|nr:ATP-dependent Clp protease ATP-binding subunit [Acidobacteriota bacterium]
MKRLNQQLNPTKTGCEAEKLEGDLKQRIVGQDEAVQQIINIYQTYLAGMSSPGRPIGSLLFLGPTGSGKTRLVEAMAESLVGDARAVVKIDCAEFQHSHEIAKLIGSPPGYLGHRETHPLLSQEAINQFHTEKVKLSFVLFDEIEKASDALWNLLLGILDKATLTLGDNRRVDFSQALIFMTSNLGASEMNSILRPNLGFAAGDAENRRAEGIVDEALEGKVNRAGIEAARRKFTPEFMNRIDKTVVFHPLGAKELRQILGIELRLVQQRIFANTGTAPFVFQMSDRAGDFLLREGTDMKYGARHLKRAVDRNLVHPLSNLIATGQVKAGDLVRVDYGGNGALSFFKDAENMAIEEMARISGVTLTPQTGVLAAGTAAEPVKHGAGARTGKQ